MARIHNVFANYNRHLKIEMLGARMTFFKKTLVKVNLEQEILQLK